MGKLEGLLEQLSKGFRNKPKDKKDRDLTTGSLYMKLESKLNESEYEYPWIIEIMNGSDGQYAIFQSGGNLYRANFIIDTNDDVVIGDNYKVKIDYPKVEDSADTEDRDKFRVFRNKQNNKLLWMGIASSSVLNRVGEIDSTELFEDFEKNFDSENEPYLTLQHLPEKFSFGTVKGVFRVNNMLIAYGEIDEETVLGRFAVDKFSSGDYGISIGFKSEEKPTLVKVGDVEIPTYNKGTLIEVSALLEERAAAYFTTITDIEQEEKRMGVNINKAKELLLEFTDDEAEEDIDNLLSTVDKRERQIDEEGLITRDTEETNNEPAVEEVEETEFVISDDLKRELVDTVSANVIELLEPKFVELRSTVSDELSELTESIKRVNDFMVEIEERNKVVEERFVSLEREESDKVREAVDDLPSVTKKRVLVTHRPTVDNESGKEKVGSGLRSVSKATRESIKSKNK